LDISPVIQTIGKLPSSKTLIFEVSLDIEYICLEDALFKMSHPKPAAIRTAQGLTRSKEGTKVAAAKAFHYSVDNV